MSLQFNLTPAIFNFNLSKMEKLIYFTVRELIEQTNRHDFSIAYIAKCAGICERTVNRWLPKLEEAGYLIIERGKRNSREKNRYWAESRSESVVCLKDSQEEYSLDNSTNLSDSQSEVDEDVPNFSGISFENMKKLVQKYGKIRVLASIRYTLEQKNLENPPGFVIWAANEQNFDLSAQITQVKEQLYGKDYLSGRYADFIVH